jgi:hypothetical protein
METQIKIISGHSNDTVETFTIPKNIEVWFLEDDGSVCYVAPNVRGLKFAMLEIQNTKYKYMSGDTIKNYTITFDLTKNVPDDLNIGYVYGILSYRRDKFVEEHHDDTATLKTICDNFAMDSEYKTIVYCFFCRGDRDAFFTQASQISGGKSRKQKSRKQKNKSRKRKNKSRKRKNKSRKRKNIKQKE